MALHTTVSSGVSVADGDGLGRGSLRQTIRMLRLMALTPTKPRQKWLNGSLGLERHSHLPLPGNEGDDRENREEVSGRKPADPQEHPPTPSSRLDMHTKTQTEATFRPIPSMTLVAARTLCDRRFTISAGER